LSPCAVGARLYPISAAYESIHAFACVAFSFHDLAVDLKRQSGALMALIVCIEMRLPAFVIGGEPAFAALGALRNQRDLFGAHCGDSRAEAGCRDRTPGGSRRRQWC